jgi:flagellar protein FlaJ
MERRQHQTIASVLALAAFALAAASVALPTTLTAALGTVGAFVLLVASVHVARPRVEPEREGQATTLAHAVGVVASVATLLVGLVLVAAVVARIGEVRYLGAVPLFLSENFQFVTGPFLAVLAIGALLAGRDRLTLAAEPSQQRRSISVAISTLIALLAAAVSVPELPGEAWQTPYIVALGGALAWLDVSKLAGLPRPRQFTEWLRRAETRGSRVILQALARAGNALVLVASLAGVALLVLGFHTVGVAVVLGASLLLVVATHAAADLTDALPVGIGEDLASAESNKQKLRLLSIAPLATTILGGALAGIAMFSVATGQDLASMLSLLEPAVGVTVALLAGINLARSELPSYEEQDPARRAVATVSVSLLVGAVFFSLLLETGTMSGAVTELDLGLVFNFAAMLAASVFVYARGLFPFPSLGLEEEEEPETRTDHGDVLERRMMIVYGVAGIFVVGTLGVLTALAMGVISLPSPQTGQGRDAAFLGMIATGVVLLLSLGVVYMRSRSISAPPEEEEIEFEKSYTREEVVRMTVLGISGTLAFVLGFLGVLVFMGQLDSLAGLTLEERHSTDFFVFAILVGIGPAGYLHNRRRNRIQAIDQRLPEFMRDMAESQRTGMTLTQAVITASEGNYGALTPEIKKMAAQIEWGISFDDALRGFAERVDTPLVQRSVSLVIEASQSGGNVQDVLEAAAEDARQIQMIHSERRSGMQIYVMIIYIAFAVFLGVIGVLNVKFMPEVAKAVSGAEGVSIGSISFQEFDIQTYRTIFFHAAIVQGLGGGFVAGSMQEGKPVAGLKHAFIMTIIGYLVFRLLLGG